MTEEEAEEVKLVYAPDWPDRVTPIEEVRKRREERASALQRFDDGTSQPDWVALCTKPGKVAAERAQRPSQRLKGGDPLTL